MRYFKMYQDMEYPHRWLLGYIRNAQGEEIDHDAFQFGRQESIPTELSASVHVTGVPLDFSMTIHRTPIVSRALGEKIQQLASHDVQLIPLKTEGIAGTYLILNITSTVACLDEQRSEGLEKYTVDDSVRPDRAGEYSSIARIKVKKEMIPDYKHLFRLQEYDVVMIVSEQLKDLVESSGFTGCRFTEIT